MSLFPKKVEYYPFNLLNNGSITTTKKCILTNMLLLLYVTLLLLFKKEFLRKQYTAILELSNRTFDIQNGFLPCFSVCRELQTYSAHS